MAIFGLSVMIIQAIPMVMYASGLETGYGYILILFGFCIIVGFLDARDSDSETEYMIDLLTYSYIFGFILTLIIWAGFL